MTHVWLLWQNDCVLGVYASVSAAERAAAHARGRLRDVYDPTTAWAAGKRSDCGQRWWQPLGRVARLEIQRRFVA